MKDLAEILKKYATLVVKTFDFDDERKTIEYIELFIPCDGSDEYYFIKDHLIGDEK